MVSAKNARICDAAQRMHKLRAMQRARIKTKRATCTRSNEART